MFAPLENISWLIIVPIFLLLFTVILKAVKRSGLFPERACIVAAVCVSALCIISMFNIDFSKITKSQGIISENRTEVIHEDSRQQEHEFVLLPYLTLGITILLAFVIMALIKMWTVIKRAFVSFRYNLSEFSSPLQRLFRKRSIDKFHHEDFEKKREIERSGR